MPEFNPRLTSTFLVAATLFFTMIALTACEPAPILPVFDGWLYEDVITLDPVDAPRPDLDLIALYHRTQGRDFQVRVDYLELEAEPTHDLYLYFDWGVENQIDGSDESQAEILRDLSLAIPAKGAPQAFGPDMQPRSDLIPRVIRNPDLDTLVISLNLDAVPELSSGFRMMATTAAPGETQLEDGIGPVRSDAPPPPGAPLMLAFWNSFSARTPAQALRRWQGAHTGPFGGRHGLATLLDAAALYEVPISLLDAKDPAAISALEYLDQITPIKSLAGAGLASLPDSLPVSHAA
ncbi:MAG: hypothetical protein R3335_13200, partial [Anaerolineales bacterium]|nr:hypothetical protein [Anaerolineales bacterium]